MANYYIYATDDSSSTNGDDYFNTKALENLEAFKDQVKKNQTEASGDKREDKVVYLHWSHRCEEVDENIVVQRYKEKSASGHDTLPLTFVDWIEDKVTENDTIKLLFIVTDGNIDDRVRGFDHDTVIENIFFYAFNSNKKDIAMSATSMFMCKNKTYCVYCNDKLTDKADSSKTFDYDQITVDTLETKKDELKYYIKLKFLTEKSSSPLALDEIEKLKQLKSRLLKELNITDEIPEQPINLNVKDKVVFISEFKRTKFYKTLLNTDGFDQKQRIESYISTLIAYVNDDDSECSMYHDLKFKQKFGIDVEDENLFVVYYDIMRRIIYPDIIIHNETEVPVIMVTHYDVFQNILFKNEHQIYVATPTWKMRKIIGNRKKPIATRFAKLRNTLECPLFLIYDKKFRNSIEYSCNLAEYKNFKLHGMEKGPRTRRPLIGGIVPLEEFDDYNDYILSRSYFHVKIVPNIVLVYYVIWKICVKLKYIEPSAVECLKNYVIKRIAKSKNFLALNSIYLNDPLIKVDLTTALWYCVEMSSIIFKNEPKHFTKEKMRMYCNVADYMKEILSWFQYSIDNKTVTLRTNIFKYMNKLKRLSRSQDKAMFILNEIFTKRGEFLVAEIAHPDNTFKLNFLEMNHKKPIDENVLDKAVDVEKYAHFMNHVEIADIQLCKNTLRPRFDLGKLKTMTSKVTFENDKLILKPVQEINFTRILSLCRLFKECVQENEKYPSKKDFETFVLKKKQFNGTKPVIFPTNILDAITHVYHEYEKIFPEINVSKFIEVTKQSDKREFQTKHRSHLNEFTFEQLKESASKKYENEVAVQNDLK